MLAITHTRERCTRTLVSASPEEFVAELSIEELLQRVRAGDLSAQEVLFQHALQTLEHWAQRALAGGRARPGLDRPSDIAQETAMRAFDKLATFQGSSEAEWLAWLKRIFERRRDQGWRDARRQKRDVRATRSLDSARVAETVALSHRTASEVMAHDQNWRRTLGHIFQLPEEQRDAIWMYHLKEHSVAEVAVMMGKTDKAVAGLLRRGLKTLRRRAADDSVIQESNRAAMATSSPADHASEQAEAALLAYLRHRDAGETTERRAFLAEHAECIEELTEMLQWIDHVEGILSKQDEH